MQATDPILEALAQWESAQDDLHAAHFAASRKSSAYRHGFNSRPVNEVYLVAEAARIALNLELADAGSFICGVAS